MVNTSNWDKFSKRIVLGVVVSALVAVFFLLLGIYIVGADEAMPVSELGAHRLQTPRHI